MYCEIIGKCKKHEDYDDRTFYWLSFAVIDSHTCHNSVVKGGDH
jgi:hypothetical protein